MALFSKKSDDKPAAFFVATVKVKDPALFADYAQKAGATFKQFGGEPVLRGRYNSSMAGEADAHQAVGIVKFENMDRLKAWYDSPAYQAIIPLRNAASDMIIAAYEAPA